MYKTLFDKVEEKNTFWGNLRASTKALIIGVLLVAFTFGLGTIANFTQYHFAPFIVLGILYGALAARILSEFLAPKLQSAAAGVIAGLAGGNIGTYEAKLREAIRKTSESIRTGAGWISLPMGQDPSFNKAIVWCIWTAICTTIVILGANAYFANNPQNSIGDPR